MVAFVRISVAPVPKGDGAFGIESDRLVKIGDGPVIIALVRINLASVPKGVCTLGVESDRCVKIGEGPRVIAFVCVSDAPVAECESALGIKSGSPRCNQRALDRDRLCSYKRRLGQ